MATVSSEYARKVINQALIQYSGEISDFGRMSAKTDEPKTYHDAHFMVVLETKSEEFAISNNRELEKFQKTIDSNKNVVLERYTPGKAEITVNTDRGKIGYIIKK